MNSFKKNFETPLVKISWLISFALALAASPLKAENLQHLDTPVNWSELPAQCKKFIRETMPAQKWRGGFITVPQNWSKPRTSRKIKVFYYYKSSKRQHKAQPILFLNGGPFFSYQHRMPALDPRIVQYDPKAKNVFFMMDQRGTGCSIPLMPQSPKTRVRTLSLYASEGVVKDAEALRRKLFPQKKWKLFAQSYGGFLTLRYLQLFPQSVHSVHLHGPVIHESVTDFFLYRILRQNFVLKKFLKYYKDQDLQRAFRKMASPQGMQYCVPADKEFPGLCGQVLLDAILLPLGQGLSRQPGQTDIWDSVAQNLRHFIRSQPIKSDPHYQKFIQEASRVLGFFRAPSSLVVSTIWATEQISTDGSPATDCSLSYMRLRARGVKVKKLPFDECRLIQKAKSPKQRRQLRAQFKDIRFKKRIRHRDVIQTLANHPQIKFYMYTGELDFLAQPKTLKTFIRSPRVHYKHFKTGHAGWMFEPLVWKTLMR